MLNNVVSSAVLLAPAVFATHMNSPALRALAEFNVADVFTFFGVKEFLPSTDSEVFSEFCSTSPESCSNVLAMVCGYNPDNIDERKLKTYLKYCPAGTSVRNMVHWA